MEWAEDIGSRSVAGSYVPVQSSSFFLRVFYRTFVVGKHSYLTPLILIIIGGVSADFAFPSLELHLLSLTNFFSQSNRTYRLNPANSWIFFQLFRYFLKLLYMLSLSNTTYPLYFSLFNIYFSALYLFSEYFLQFPLFKFHYSIAWIMI